jgi:uncharacterized protein YeaC (DUF1315 family)
MGLQQGMPRTLTFANRFGDEIRDAHLDDVDDDHDSAYDYSAADDIDPDDTSLSSSSSDSSDSAGSYPTDPAGVVLDDDEETQTDDNHGHNEEAAAQEIDDYANEDYADGNAFALNPAENTGVELNIPAETTGVELEIPGQNTGVMLEENTGMLEENTGVPGQNTGVLDENAGMDNNNDDDSSEQITTPTPRVDLRPRQPKRDPVHLVGNGFEDKYSFLTSQLHTMLLTAQMSAKKGLKVFGNKGAEAITTELEQLHYRRVVKPVDGTTLTREQKRACLHYLMFLKQKRCGKIKARGCADGRKQRLWKTKEETSSPTVRTESVYISATIDAMEHRRVMTCDIPGAFMQADIDEIVHVKFEGEIAELFAQVDPTVYNKFVITEHGKPTLYVQLQKALYGTVQAALLFWKELTQFLVEDLGFELNPYDQCVANKMINGKQCTILWHVDDLKISHVDQQVLENLLNRLNERFGKEQELSVTRGNKHDYLGMTIDYSTSGRVQFTMLDYIDNMLNELPDDMSGTVNTPAANHLFEVNPQGVKLDKDKAEFFHTQVAKLLYLCKRARPDIHTAVAFLTTRVTAPDTDDYGKLRRCMRYLRGTKDLPLTLVTPPGPINITWSVDASFAVHPDMKSHTGATLSLGSGVLYSMSTRQKLNTKSSTEAELVGVDDAMSAVTWTRNFIEAQGQIVNSNTVLQDNQSAILLEKNGMKSSGKRTRHINIRYFFIKDRVENNELQIKYCPTEEMLADILTKPLQGSQFYKLRNRMLNICDEPSTTKIHTSFTTSQECVETSSQGEDVNDSNKSNRIKCVINEDDVANDEWTVVESKKRRKQKS